MPGPHTNYLRIKRTDKVKVLRTGENSERSGTTEGSIKALAKYQALKDRFEEELLETIQQEAE